LNRKIYDPIKRPGVDRNTKKPEQQDWKLLKMGGPPPQGMKAFDYLQILKMPKENPDKVVSSSCAVTTDARSPRVTRKKLSFLPQDECTAVTPTSQLKECDHSKKRKKRTSSEENDMQTEKLKTSTSLNVTTLRTETDSPQSRQQEAHTPLKCPAGVIEQQAMPPTEMSILLHELKQLRKETETSRRELEDLRNSISSQRRDREELHSKEFVLSDRTQVSVFSYITVLYDGIIM